MQTLAPMPDGYDAYYLAQQSGFNVYVALNDRRMLDMAAAVRAFNPEIKVLEFPAWDCTPYDRSSPDSLITGQRLATLAALLKNDFGDAVLITTVNALAQRVPPKEFVDQHSLHFKGGKSLDIEDLRKNLVSQGYYSTPTVRETGEFAVRGGIVDIFIAGQPHPIRIDLFDDEIEKIVYFDALTQRTIEQAPEISLLPVREMPFDEEARQLFRRQYRLLAAGNTEDDPLYNAVSEGRYFKGVEHFLPLFFENPLPELQSYWPDNATVYYDKEAMAAIEATQQSILDCYQVRAEVAKLKKFDGFPFYPLEPETLYNAKEVIKEHNGVLFSNFKAENSVDTAIRIPPAMPPVPDPNFLAEVIKDAFKEKKRVIMTVDQESQRQKLLEKLRPQATYPVFELASFEEAMKKPQKSVCILLTENSVYGGGFVTEKLILFTAVSIFGERLNRKVRKRKAEDIIREASSLTRGDMVVHEEHGVGQYQGLELLDVGGQNHDMVLLHYSGGDKLYVPVENIDILSRFGDSDSTAQLDKLGGVAWQARKAKAKERIRAIAAELIKIAAERALRTGETITPEAGTFEEFCNRFPYIETEDQLNAIQDVLSDMAGGKPMDRLICGDVGFGKTEVAMRAAFIAAMQGYQVMIVAPTTLLARQHFNSFKERFAGFPLVIKHLSRLVNAKEANIVREGLTNGTVDVVIGTHALLAKSVTCKRLGLVIVDEEQRFGVKQKERLKEYRSDVHYLTLSATPIPRTMQMAMQGVRDMSIIATPPVDRLSIRSFITPFDRVSIREALMREHYRGGQSYFICPRIKDMAEMQAKLKDMVPELKIVAAHGQMTPKQLEDIMEAFQNGEYDVLLATQIIESGIDIAKANTIVIHRAHMFGLAQLYQLRGRVGRAKIRAYALLTYPPKMQLSKDATKRLEVMQTLDHLGAGFSLAGHDLDIRGAGNLLGEEQSGHIREVGVELYQQMLKDAVETAQAEAKLIEKSAVNDNWSPVINLGLPVLIPEEYVPDLDARMHLYRRAVELENSEQRQEFREELQDRFGKLPQTVENLLHVVGLKTLCLTAGVAKVDVGPKGVVITFHNNQFAKPEKLLKMIEREKGTVKLKPDQKLVYLRVFKDRQQVFKGVEQILNGLIDL